MGEMLSWACRGGMEGAGAGLVPRPGALCICHGLGEAGGGMLACLAVHSAPGEPAKQRTETGAFLSCPLCRPGDAQPVPERGVHLRGHLRGEEPGGRVRVPAGVPGPLRPRLRQRQPHLRQPLRARLHGLRPQEGDQSETQGALR